MVEQVKLRALFSFNTDDADLLKAQLTAMTRQLPLLYIGLSINIAALAFSFYGKAPDFLTVWCPVLTIILFVARAIKWFYQPNLIFSPKRAAFELKTLTFLAVTLSGALTIWTMLLYPYGDVYQQGHAVFFVSVTLIGTMFALVQLPIAAIGCLMASGIIFTVFLATRGHPVYSAMAFNLVFVLLITCYLIYRYFGNMLGFLRSNSQLLENNEQMAVLFDEVKFHRDHLAEQVSDRTRALEEQALKLELALAAERRTNQMQNEFVSMVSHEFRTPLAIIDGTARRVLRRGEEMSFDDLSDRMSKIRGSVMRLSSLVERTLDASKLAAGTIGYEPDWYDPGLLLREIVERMTEITPGFGFDLNISDIPERMFGDLRLIDHVLTNVISNAIKYSQDCKTATISAETDGETCVIRIRDYGVGIPKSEIGRVTNRFFRASTAVGIQGTGIGLNLVSRLVEMHGGKMNIESEVGHWTEVTLKLPVMAPKRQPADDAEAVEPVNYGTTG